MRPINARLAVVMGLLAATASMSASAQQASPMAVACHDEATKRYIADFRRLGVPQKESDDVVSTTFVNDTLRYEDYYAECMARWNSRKTR